MTTRQDIFAGNMVEFLIEQEKRHLISRGDYIEFYDFLHEWNKESTTAHPREESTYDCLELLYKGTHV